MNIDSALIPIGGKGTRLKSYSSKPKLLTNLNNKPLINYTLENLSKQGLKNIFLISNKSSELIEDHCSLLCKDLCLNLEILREKNLSGNFGGIIENCKKMPSEFFVVYPDLLWTCDLKRIINYHQINQSSITLIVRRTDHGFDSDTVKLNPYMRVKKLYSKVKGTKFEKWQENDLFGATGMYLMNKNFLLKANNKKDYLNKEIDLFESILTLWNDLKIQINAFPTSSYVKDCGTPERFKLVEDDLKKNLVYKAKEKILFLDRDGTLINCKNGEYITTSEQVELNPRIIKIYKKLTSEGYIPVVITNQPQLSFGMINLEILDRIHCKIQDLLEQKKLKKIFRFIFCPHHPHNRFEDEKDYLKFTCNCRKPETGMFFELQRWVDIDIENSLMIGDSNVDSEFASKCNLKFKHIDQL